MAIEDSGQVKTCLNHPDRTAVARCHTCHKPLCRECVVSTTEGSFCSRECASKAADFKAHYKGPVKTGPGLVARVIKLAILVVVIAVVLVVAGKAVPAVGSVVSRLPILGRFVR